MIVCFSGNGNSRLVASRLAGALGDTLYIMKGVPPMGLDSVRCADDCVVWVMPVHSWGIPVAVAKSIAMTPAGAFAPGGRHYLVLTCGDDCGHSHRQWRRAVAEKGWHAAAAWTVMMPNTYVLLPGFDVDAPEVSKAKLEAMPARVDAIAAAISQDTDARAADDVVEGSLPGLKSAVVYPLFSRFDIRPALFRASDACVGCGRCSAVCPLGNIVMADGKPVWGGDCTQCLGCYNCCPQGAISYGRRTRGKGRWFAPAP